MKPRILFILKKRQVYSETEAEYSTVHSGLYNSANFVNQMFQGTKFESKLVEVVDNNQIDKEVSIYRPDIVIIEALWVVPEKFDVLTQLHPDVKWVVRLHSETAFLANEGVAMEWLKKYDTKPNVFISSNSKYLISAFKDVLKSEVSYTPNYYPTDSIFGYKSIKNKNKLIVGCFGAIRPLKNQFTQAIAAIKYAENENLILEFHMNAARVEQNGQNPLKNIKALFERTRHKLVLHDWLSHDDFLRLVSKMDIGLQVSLTETYNIVTADFIRMGVPIVTSDEMNIVSGFSHASTKDIDNIIKVIRFNLAFNPILSLINKIKLKCSSYRAKKEWFKTIQNYINKL